MKQLHLKATLAALLVFTLGSAASAQPNNFVSEADRQLGNFKRTGSADQLRQQTVARDTAVGGGLAGTTVRAPSSSSPAPHRAASFGGGTVGTMAGPATKPFSNVSSSPTVSPYMNLFRTDLGGNDDLNYQTLVQPQIRQMEFNRRVDIQEQQINRRLQAIAAQNAYGPRGSTRIMPTGHPATHRYYSHYYPGLRRR